MVASIEDYQKKEQDYTSLCSAQQKEVDESRDAIESFSSKRDEMDQMRKQLVQQMEKVKDNIRKKKELQLKERKALNEQMALISPEVYFWEQTLGLRIEGVQEDVLKFEFTNVDEKDYSRAFSCTLDLSEADYKIIKCKPELSADVVEAIVKGLNETRRVNLFLKNLRKAFKDLT